MKKSFTLFSIFFVVIISIADGVIGQSPDPVDNDYWVVPLGVPLDIVSESNTKVRIRYGSTSITRTVTSAGHVESVPSNREHKKIVNLGIHVWSLDSLPFKLSMVISTLDETCEGTWCIPTNSLGKCYRLASYQSIDSIDDMGILTKLAPGFGIVATQDSTMITIDFPPGKGLAPITIVMDAGQAYGVDCGRADVNIDPTGTRVTADKPITVFTTHPSAIVPYGRSYISADGQASNLLEQMIPIESWGQLHMSVAAPNRAGDSYRILGDENNTEIFIDGVSVATVNAGEYFETILFGMHEIYSTKPVMVVGYTQAGVPWTNGGPSMLVIPSVDRYVSSTQFYIMAGIINRGYLVVIAPMADADKVELDGVLLGATNYFVPMPQSANNPVLYGSTFFANSTTAHTLKYSSTPSVPNSLWAYFVANDLDLDETIIQSVAYRGKYLPNIEASGIDFGVLVCTDELTTTIPIRNTGYAPLVIASATGLVGTSFELLNPTIFPDTIYPQSSKNYTIKFQNTSVGTYMATLNLLTNESGCGISGSVAYPVQLAARKERTAITSAPASYDFGNVTCQKYETTVTMTNVGTVDVQVTDKTFTQAGISIVSPNLPATIKPGDTQSFIIRLDATVIPSGAYSSTLHLVSQPCDLTSDFTFTANRKALVYSVSPTSKDFGITAVNKTSTGTFTFDNQSDVPVHIASAQFDNASFSVTTTFGQTVAPYSSLAINFTCSPPDTLKYESTLTINIDSPCVDDRKVLVRVEGASVCPQAVITEVLGKVPGDKVSIPIIIDPSTKFVSSKQIDLTVKYDPALLRSAGDPVARIGTVSNVKQLQGGVSFTLTVPGLPSPSAIVADIPVQALLAPYADGMIDVSASMFTLSDGNQIAGTSCPVPFSLGHDCVRQDELKSRPSAMIEGIYPNPSYMKTIVEIIAKNNPKVRLEVYDTFGRQVEVLNDGSLSDGKHEVTINTESYTTGIYFCRLIHNGEITTKAFNVER